MTDPMLLKPCLVTAFFALLVALAPDRVLAGTVTSTASLSPNDARLYEATAALAAGEADRADKLLIQSTAPLDDYRALTRAKALVALGKKEKAYAELETIKPRVLKCTEPKTELAHPLYVDAVLAKADLLAESEPSAAAELLAALPAAGDVLARAADLYRRAGDTGQAEKMEARLLVEVPDAPEARGLAKALKASGVKERLPTEDQRLERIRKLLDTHQNMDARTEALKLADELGDKSGLRCELLFIAGKADRKLRAYAGAVKTLGQARERCLKDEETELALRSSLLEVQVQTIRGQLAPAKKVAEWMAKTYPDHSFGDDALLLVANLLDDSGKSADAKKVYEKILEMPANDQGGEAAWRIAYGAIRAGEVAEATKRLESVLARADVPPGERARARFWLAMTVLPKDEAKAKTLFEQVVLEPTFYSWLALDRLETLRPAWARDFKKQLVAVRDGPSPGVGAPAAAAKIVDAPELDRARRLYAIGAQVYAEAELEVIAPCASTDAEVLALALAFDAIEAHPRAQQLLRAHPAMFAGAIREDNIAVWRAAYSRPYLDLVEKAAKESKVPPLFLMSLAREESTFDPKIVSWAGATGLAQLMPGTAILAHLSLGLGKLDPERLIEPELNLRLGARVLRDAMKDFGDREPLALVAYNGGPGVAKKLADVSPPKPFERWVEEISIKETRGYVKRVMETYGVYRFLYDKEKPFLSFPPAIGAK